jgi:hypothetical protein
MSKSDVSAGITGFIDILGFSDRVLAAQTIADVKEVGKLVARIRSEFDYSTRDSLTKEVHSLYKKTVLAFTDCVIINIPLQSDATEYEGTFDPIMSELVGFAYAQGACALDKLFIRGGIDIGWWYRSGSSLISQSMVRAYKAEGKANVPVIALTEEVYKFFSDHKHRDYYSDDSDPIKRTLRRYEAGEGNARVEFWYLDYISICVESVGWQRSKAQHSAYRAASPDEKQQIMNEGYRENVDCWFDQHARSIEEAHANSSDSKVKAKYEWLEKYHNEIAVTFTATPKCLCKIA